LRWYRDAALLGLCKIGSRFSCIKGKRAVCPINERELHCVAYARRQVAGEQELKVQVLFHLRLCWMLYAAQVTRVDGQISEALQVLTNAATEALWIDRDGLELLHAE